jgi:ArsR family transcriptional regulator, zinc-responsive transcriptional repressor
VYGAETERAAGLFRALSAPLRLAILRRLDAAPSCVHELVESTGASQSLVSQHLKVLRAAQLVRGERRGKEVVYSIMDAHVNSLISEALAHTAEPVRDTMEQPALLGKEHHEHEHA